jgi:hypothetical protein
MAVSFMAILAIAIEERVDAKAGAILLWPLIATGVFSLYLWRWTGDLRLYGWVQFFRACCCRCSSYFFRQIYRHPIGSSPPPLRACKVFRVL